MTLNVRSEAVRRRLLRPWNFRLYLWARLPLAACAGLSLRRLDEAACTVALPGGWRTQNPFRSMYFAATIYISRTFWPSIVSVAMPKAAARAGTSPAVDSEKCVYSL